MIIDIIIHKVRMPKRDKYQALSLARNINAFEKLLTKKTHLEK
jgi:hypothetical protein